MSDSVWPPWTAAGQTPLFMGFSRQEYWSGVPLPSPEDLPDPGIEPMSLMSPALAGGFFRCVCWDTLKQSQARVLVQVTWFTSRCLYSTPTDSEVLLCTLSPWIPKVTIWTFTFLFLVCLALRRLLLLLFQLLSHVQLFANCSMPGFPVPHSLPEFAQVHVHWTGDTIQPSHSLSPLFPLPSISPSIKVFSNESALRIRWPKCWSCWVWVSPKKQLRCYYVMSGLTSLQFYRLKNSNNTET